MNGMFKLDLASIGDAALMAALGAVVALFVGLVGTNGFDVFSADWITLGKEAVNVAIAAAVLSIGKDFVSNNQGQIMGLGKPYQQ